MYIGIDGGQTKTVGILISENGEILAREQIKAMPFNGELTESCKDDFKELVNSLCTSAGVTISAVQQLCGGLCGIDIEEQRVEKTAILSQVWNMPQEKIHLVNDGIIALWAATKKPNSLLLQHGTAFTSAIRSSNGKTTPFDPLDIGRIYDIRQELIVFVARMIDGRREATSLKEKTIEFLGTTEERFCFDVDYDIIPPEHRRKTVGLIVDAWQEGDTAAAELMRNAAEDYGAMIDIMVPHCAGNNIEVVMGGGLLNRVPDAFFSLCEKLCKTEKSVHFSRPLLEPVIGAALFAAAKDGHSIEKLFDALR